MNRIHNGICISLMVALQSCHGQQASDVSTHETDIPLTDSTALSNIAYDTGKQTIHVFVALCDNAYQGIVPVPERIGNGQDPNNNLYWGCGYGVRTYFKKSTEWKLVSQRKVDTLILERLVFKHVSKNYYLIADAYNGQYIEQCTIDFLEGTCGRSTDTLMLGADTLGIAGNAQLLAYVGHDGLMDFQLSDAYMNVDQRSRDAIILACYSKSYFSNYMDNAQARPLVWTTGLMAPEAYTLHDAISGYVLDETAQEIRSRAALAYAKYQKCSVGAAKNLLTTGW